MEASLVVAVPEATPFVHHIRERFDPYSSIGVPAHVTALYPFFTAETLDDSIDDRVSAALAHVAGFDYELTRVMAFDESSVYLAPEPADRFVALTNALWDRFPESRRSAASSTP